MHVIPAIDLIEGKCVRLQQGLYSQKTIYHEDPVEVAKEFEAHGISRLHLVDLDGAKAKKVINWYTLERIVKGTRLLVDFAGGIKGHEDLTRVMDCGAHQVTIGSVAVDHPAQFQDWLEEFGPDRIILGADLRNGTVATHGWQRDSKLYWKDFISMHLSKGVKYVICTDIGRDGMLSGPSFELYGEIQKHFEHLKLIASGGVSNVQDLQKLRQMGLYGAIVGKAIYEGHVTLNEIREFQENAS